MIVNAAQKLLCISSLLHLSFRPCTTCSLLPVTMLVIIVTTSFPSTHRISVLYISVFTVIQRGNMI